MIVLLIISLILLVVGIIVFSLTGSSNENYNSNEKQKKFSKCLNDMKKILDKEGQTFFLVAGTFLGQHRENRFIPHDNDIDIGIFAKDYKSDIINKIKQSKNFNLRKILGREKDSLEIQFRHHNGVNLDIFLVYPTSKKYNYYITTHLNKICDSTKEGFCKWERIIKGLEPVKFIGNTYLVPSNKEEYLVSSYGKNWRTPKKYNYSEGISKKLYKGLMN